MIPSKNSSNIQMCTFVIWLTWKAVNLSLIKLDVMDLNLDSLHGVHPKVNLNVSLSCLNQTNLPKRFITFIRALCAPLAGIINYDVVIIITPTRTQSVSNLEDDHFYHFYPDDDLVRSNQVCVLTSILDQRLLQLLRSAWRALIF